MRRAEVSDVQSARHICAWIAEWAEHRSLGGVGAAGQRDRNQRGYQRARGGIRRAEVSDARKYQTRGGSRQEEASDARSSNVPGRGGG